MSAEELKRVQIMARVKAGGPKLSDAAEMLGIGYRQAKRIWGQYRKRGPDGLQHGNAAVEPGEAGQVPAAGAEADRQEVLGRCGYTVWAHAGRAGEEAWSSYRGIRPPVRLRLSSKALLSLPPGASGTPLPPRLSPAARRPGSRPTA